MAIHALVWPVTIKTYSDNTFTTVTSEVNSYWSISELTGAALSPTWVTDNTSINLFQPYVKDLTYLGNIFQYKTDGGTYGGFEPSRFMPLSLGYHYSDWFVDIVFKNGAYILNFQSSSTSGNNKNFCLSDGTVVGSLGNFSNVIGHNINNFYGTETFGATEIIDDKITGTLKRIIFSADYNRTLGYWQQIVEIADGNLDDLVDFVNNYLPIPLSDDPLSPGGYTEPDGGDGTWDNTSDSIPLPTVPNLSATASGFLNIYTPSIQEAKEFADFLHTNDTQLALYKTIFGNVQECVLGFGVIPVEFSSSDVERIPSVNVGNVPTGIGMYRVIPQYITASMGELDIEEYFGSYLDYSPNTQIEIYLPYIGTKTLDTDLLMGHTLGVTYYIDVASGTCTANITVDDNVIYVFTGECLATIPITQLDLSNIIQANVSMAISTVGNVVRTVASQGASAAREGLNFMSNLATNLPHMFKPHLQKTGALSTQSAMFAPQTPYLIITRNRPSVPETYDTHYGYPSNIKAVLSSLEGYTEVASIHLENVPATSDELDEIVSLLEGGVII